jgi:hypothetical protein
MTRPARQAIVAIYRAIFPSAPDWPEGPLPLSHEGIHADTASRSTYYPPRTTRVLYGTPGHPRRWHKAMHHQVGDLLIIGIEALRLHEKPDAEGLIMVHLQARNPDALTVVRTLAGRDTTHLREYDPHRLLEGQIHLSSAAPFTITFITPQGRRLPRLYPRVRYAVWPVADQWLWALASRTNYADHPPDTRNPGRPEEERIRLSADWCGMVLRDGMALVGTRPDQGRTDPFYNHARLYSHTLYLDAIVLALLQLQGINELEDALAVAINGSTAMNELERQITLFRHELWWQHLSTHGVPNQILGAFHRQHRLPERFEQVLAEINDFNRLARDDETRHVNNALVLFTVVTVPAGIALALLQVIGSKDPWLFTTVLATCAIVTGLLLLTRPARLGLRSIRRRLTP